MNRSRKDCLGGQACEPTTLPEALHCLIQHSALDVEELAGELRRLELTASRAYLYELSNPHRPDRGVRVLALAAALTTITRRSVLLQYLCRAQGGAYVELPAALVDGATDDVRLAADALREFAAAMQAFAEGAADRVWTAEEVERLDRDAHQAIARMLQVVAHARRRALLPERAEQMARASAVQTSARRRA